LGQGGHGRVELAFDRERRARVALKLLAHPAHGAQELKREFRVLRDVASPNLVAMLELIIEPRLECLVLEHVDGTDLLRHLGGSGPGGETHGATMATGVIRRSDVAGGSRVPAEALPASFLQLVDAVAFLDRAGLVHGDLKPENILVERSTERVVVLDFGIARLASAATGAQPIGTPIYMAPEQFNGEALTGATDRYALGVLLYRALSGRFPFVGTMTQLAHAKREAPPSLGDSSLQRLAVELLHPDPRMRPTLERVRGAFDPKAPREVLGDSPDVLAPVVPLIGRELEIAALRGILQRDPPSVAILLGGAGMGKTAVLDELERELGGRALRARCYANESLRWNAIDGLVDALVGEGYRDAQPESALAALFPGLRPASSAPIRQEVTPVELVRRAARELGQMLVARNRVVVIDDAQWADTDAVSFLVELLRIEPRLRVVLSSRGPDTTSEILTIAIELAPREVSVVAIEPLSDMHTAELAAWMAGGEAIDSALLLQATGGVPFLVEQLCYGMRRHKQAPHTLRDAEGLLSARYSDMDEVSRSALVLLAVNGAPLSTDILSDLLGEGIHSAIRGLLIDRLCRLDNESERRLGRIDVYHDRIRQRLLQVMDIGDRKRAHADIAAATMRSRSNESDEIARHLLGAEDPRAYFHARKAAAEARNVFAFERAILWLRTALREPGLAERERRRLRFELADCLRLGEQHAEAAVVLDSIATDGDGVDSIDVRLNAAEQWLTAGELVRGIAAMRAVARDSGISGVELEVSALRVVRERLRLARRGLSSRVGPKLGEREARSKKLHVDVAWTLGGCLSLVDPLRAALIHTVGTERALDLGEPERVLRALLGEAIMSGMFGTRSKARTSALLERVEQMADKLDNHARGLVVSARSIAEIQAGEFALGLQSSVDGLTLLARHPKTVGWELMTTRHFHLHALYYMGRFRELEAYIEEEYRVSHARRNRHRTSDVSLGHAAVSCLLTHGRQVAIQRVDEATLFWADVGTNLQGYYSQVAASLIALWEGDGPGAWRAYRVGQSGALPLQLLMPEGLRVDLLHNLGRASIARALSSRAWSHIAVALGLTWALAIEPQAHALPLARLQLAGLAASLNLGNLSRRLASQAERAFSSQALAGYAAAASAMRAARFDPTPFEDLGIAKPRELAAVLAPGSLGPR